MHYTCKKLIILCLVETHHFLDPSTHKDNIELIEIYLSVALELELLEYIYILKYMYMDLGTTTHKSLIEFQESIRIANSSFHTILRLETRVKQFIS